MNYIGKCLTNFKEFYNEINAATLTGAIDVVIVQQTDGTYLSSPFHVRFGKIGVLKSKEKVVDIEINGAPVGIHMKLGESGEAFFVNRVPHGETLADVQLATSPLPAEHDITGQHDLSRAQEQQESAAAGLIDGRQLDVNEPRCVGGAGADERLDTTSSSGGEEIGVQLSGAAVSSSAVAAGGSDGGGCEFRPISSVGGCEERNRRRRQRRRRAGRQHQRSLSDTRMLQSVIKQQQQQQEQLQQDSQQIQCGLERQLSLLAGVCVSAGSANTAAADAAAVGRSSSLASPLALAAIQAAVAAQQQPQQQQQPECHPFSDTDISPVGSRRCSRSPSPIKSDTEYEMERERSTAPRAAGAVWQWGELPTSDAASTACNPAHCDSTSSDAAATQPDSPLAGEAAQRSSSVSGADSSAAAGASVSDQQQQRSMLAGVFSFMRKTKKVRHDPLSEGIYLDDLDLESLDPRVAALYFPRRGATRSRSESAAAASPSAGAGAGVDTDEGNGSTAPSSPAPAVLPLPSDVALSLCGAGGDQVTDERFDAALVDYGQFADDPAGVLQRGDLVVRVDGRYYSWPAAAAVLCSLLAFGRRLPDESVRRLEGRRPDDDGASLRPPDDAKKSSSVSSSSGGAYSWFSWRRYSEPSSEADKRHQQEPQAEHSEITEEATATAAVTLVVAVEEAESSDQQHEVCLDVVCDEDDDNMVTTSDVAADVDVLSGDADIPAGQSEVRRPERVSESDDVAAELRCTESAEEQLYKKSLRLTSEQVEQLGLHWGQNDASFSVTTAYQGTTRCRCSIFLWRHSDKVIISDIDGTITKSDVLGHILPMIGQHWAQCGVTSLFSSISDNGYRFLYLSARAIGQAQVTREYLQSVKQGNMCLPDGPLLLSPSSLVSAFHREVIEKRPEDFKIPCLKDIRALFPGRNPLYAGFGNRINDSLSYRAVDIPFSRIFTINHRGELRHELTQVFQSSYTNLTNMVDHFFPACNNADEVDCQHEFNSLVFWRPPLLPLNSLPPLE